MKWAHATYAGFDLLELLLDNVLDCGSQDLLVPLIHGIYSS